MGSLEPSDTELNVTKKDPGQPASFRTVPAHRAVSRVTTRAARGVRLTPAETTCRPRLSVRVRALRADASGSGAAARWSSSPSSTRARHGLSPPASRRSRSSPPRPPPGRRRTRWKPGPTVRSPRARPQVRTHIYCSRRGLLPPHRSSRFVQPVACDAMGSLVTSRDPTTWSRRMHQAAG